MRERRRSGAGAERLSSGRLGHGDGGLGGRLHPQRPVRDGVLIVDAVGEGAATVTVTATDADGLMGRLRFEVLATELLRNSWRGWRVILLQQAADDG